jgi:hypothetical protein
MPLQSKSYPRPQANISANKNIQKKFALLALKDMMGDGHRPSNAEKTLQ